MKKIKEVAKLETPIFTVVEKEFKQVANFKPVGLNCPDWVMVVLLDRKGKSLFVKQSRWGEETQTIEFPCGTVEAGEQPEHAAVRELKEEAGIELDVSKLTLHYSFNPNPSMFKNRMRVYSAIVDDLEDLFKKRGPTKLDTNEDCEAFVEDLRKEKDELMWHATGLIGYRLACRLQQYMKR